MADFSAGFVSTGAGSATLPIASLFATAAIRPVVRQIGVFNTTAVAVQIAIRRVTAVGTPGAAIDALPIDDPQRVALATPFNTHTVTPTFINGYIKVAQLGAAVGSGVIFTFPGRGLTVPDSTGDGIVIVPIGTGQICTGYIDWEE